VMCVLPKQEFYLIMFCVLCQPGICCLFLRPVLQQDVNIIMLFILCQHDFYITKESVNYLSVNYPSLMPPSNS